MSAVNEVIRASFFTPTHRGWGLPLLLWGLPGVGKTSIIEGIARDCGMSIKVLSPGEQGEGAFGVIPMPIATSEGIVKMTYPSPDWIDAFEDTDDRGVVFVDELTTAPPALQPALLGLLQAGRIGSAVLPPTIRIIGAANPPECAAGGFDISPPVANRLGHVNWPTPDASEWSEWLLGAEAFLSKVTADTKHAIAEEARVLAAWDAEFAKSKGIISSFVKSRPNLLMEMPKAGDPESSRAWCSPRSWENATRAMTAASVHNVSVEARSLLINAFIGQGASIELIQFLQNIDLPDPESVLDGTVVWRYNPARVDQTFAVLTSCVAVVSTTKDAQKQASRAKVMWDLFQMVLGNAPDMVVATVRPMLEKKHGIATPEAVRVMGSLRPMLQAAGISP